jgi:hypothetical protein
MIPDERADAPCEESTDPDSEKHPEKKDRPNHVAPRSYGFCVLGHHSLPSTGSSERAAKIFFPFLFPTR